MQWQTDLDQEHERAKQELRQETQMKEMLEQSLIELKLTTDELHKRLSSVDEETNEWKIRYEMQVELNQMLQRQALSMHEKVEVNKKQLQELMEEERGKLQDKTLSPGRAQMKAAPWNNQEVHPQVVRELQKRAGQLQNELKELESRLDTESRAFHRAQDDRKTLLLDIGRLTQEAQKLRAKHRSRLDLVLLAQVADGLPLPDDDAPDTPPAPRGAINIATLQKVAANRKTSPRLAKRHVTKTEQPAAELPNAPAGKNRAAAATEWPKNALAPPLPKAR